VRIRSAHGLAAVATALAVAACTPEAPRIPAPREEAPVPPPVAREVAPARTVIAREEAASARPVVAREEAANWVAALEVPGRLRAEAPSRGLVRIAARGGMHVNEEYPTSFRPAPDATASFAGDRVALSDVVERVRCDGGEPSACEVTYALPFVPRGAGDVRVSGTLAFSVCNAERCLIEKVALTVVSAAAAR